MHLRTHLSGQISGQIPNQAASELSNHQLQNGSSIPPSVQTLSGLRNICSMDPDLEMKRKFVREKIYQKLAQQRPQMTIEMQQKMGEIVKRLEDGLFKISSSEEEYMNMDTLENRLFTLIRRLPAANHTQQLPNLPASSSHSTMIPTPGIIHSGNINLTVTSSMDSSVNATGGYSALVPNTVNVGNLLPNANGSSAGIYGSSLGASDGALSNRYQQSPSLGLMGSGSNNGQVSVGMRSTLQQDILSYGFSNMDLNGGPVASDGYLATSQYGDDYAMSTVDPSGPGNLYGRNLN